MIQQPTKHDLRMLEHHAEKTVEKLPEKVQWVFAHRYMTKEDENLVYGTWSRNLRSFPPYRSIKHAPYQKGIVKQISQILARPATRVLVAVHPSTDGEPKFGWICYEKRKRNYLHYVYVRNTFRQHNIASALLQFAGIDVDSGDELVATAWTKSMSHLKNKWNLTYEPFPAWGETDEE